MQYIVMAHDAKDDNALERRLAAREEHLKFASEMFRQGKWLFASALLDENGNMNGSVIACEFSSEEELKKEWLDNEAYILENVWSDISIRKARIVSHKK